MMFRALVAGLVLSTTVLAADSAAVTFNKDVLPILQKQCQGCHRPGEVAPMSFLSYSETRPWAKAIKAAVVTKKMPPWFADPKYGHFTNERKLSETEIGTLVSWADNGALEGDAKDKPAPVTFAGGWSIGQPDIVVEFPHDIALPATGNIDQSNVLVKVNFPKDVWVKAAEVRPGNPKVVHHMKAWIRPPGSTWMNDAPNGELYHPLRGQFGRGAGAAAPAGAQQGAAGGGQMAAADRSGEQQDMLAKYNPGVNGQEFSLGDAAKFIPAGSDIIFECHYVTTGKPETDRSRVGIVLASQPPAQRYVTITGLNNNRFVIPARNPYYEVKAEATVQNETRLAWVQPHMHYRAVDYELKAYWPSGEVETLMKTKFDFNWQLGYEFAKPILLPKGTKLEMTAHYDNSANNPYNPDPSIDVRYGAQSTDEMAVSFMGFVIDRKADPAKLFPRRAVPVAFE